MQHQTEQTAPISGRQAWLVTWRALAVTFSCLLMRLYMAASSRSKCTLLGFRRLLRLTAGRGASSPSEELSPPLRLCSTQAGASALGRWLPHVRFCYPHRGAPPPLSQPDLICRPCQCMQPRAEVADMSCTLPAPKHGAL